MNWEHNLLEDDEQIRDMLAATHRIAVLGIRSEAYAERPAFYVPHYLDDAGFEVLPVPVLEPKVTEILGRPTHARLADIPGSVDLVQIFRRDDDIPAHVDDILAAKPATVWMQQGIRNDTVAEQLARAGIRVVQDRCLMVEHRRLMR